MAALGKDDEVSQPVDPAECAHRFLHEALAIKLRCNISHDSLRATACRFDLLLQCSEAVRAPCSHHDRCDFDCQPARGSFAYPSRSAGHDHDLAIKLAHRSSTFSRRHNFAWR